MSSDDGSQNEPIWLDSVDEEIRADFKQTTWELSLKATAAYVRGMLTPSQCPIDLIGSVCERIDTLSMQSIEGSICTPIKKKQFNLETNTLLGLDLRITTKAESAQYFSLFKKALCHVHVSGIIIVRKAKPGKLQNQGLEYWLEALEVDSHACLADEMKRCGNLGQFIDHDGQKFKRSIWEKAMILKKNGISQKEACMIFADALDGGRVTETELHTLKYIVDDPQDIFKPTAPAKEFLNMMIEAILKEEGTYEKHESIAAWSSATEPPSKQPPCISNVSWRSSAYVAQVVILVSAAQALFHLRLKPTTNMKVHMRYIGGLVRCIIDALCFIGLRKDWPELAKCA